MGEEKPTAAATDAAAKAELDRAFEDLYRAHLRDVYSYSYYRIGNHHDAEDVTEQAFLQAYRHFERARRESTGRPELTEAIWAVAYLVTLGSVGLFVLVLLVVRRWTASATSYMFVLFPVVTMALGALLGDETITAQAVVGAVVVMFGVWFGALSPGARRLAAELPVPRPARTTEPADAIPVASGSATVRLTPPPPPC